MGPFFGFVHNWDVFGVQNVIIRVLIIYDGLTAVVIGD